MTSVYNELYDNDAYCALARAIADHMGVNYDSPTNEYLDVMVEIQDKAIAYSLLQFNFSRLDVLRVCYHEDVYQAYIDFMQPFASYYRQKMGK